MYWQLPSVRIFVFLTVGQNLKSCCFSIFIVVSITDLFNEFLEGLKFGVLYLCLGSHSSVVLG